MTHNENPIIERLEALAKKQEEHSRILATLESRILLIHDETRRTSETVTRLKLMADNAKKAAAAQGKQLEAILAKLASLGD